MQWKDIALKQELTEKRRIIFKLVITIQTRRELERQGHIRGDKPEQDIQISNKGKKKRKD